MTPSPSPTLRTPRKRLATVLKASALIGLGMGGAFAAPHLLRGREADAQQIVVTPPRGAPASFADLIDKVSPAVVAIDVKGKTRGRGENGGPDGQEDEDGTPRDGLPPEAEEFFRRFGIPRPQQPDARPSRVAGSGFFISADGLIVTNNHVVEDASEITVTLSDERELKAKLVGNDPRTDLAVLRTEEKGPFPFVGFARNTKPRVGDWVIAIGNPFDLGTTVTAGIVSAVARDTNDQYVDFLQIDAPINRGNSGGPTFDLYGRVIGVNSQILSPTGGSVGIGFAIPADTADKIVKQLIDKGRVLRGWLGVTIGPVSDSVAAATGLKEARGALISAVREGSPAEKGGLKGGDIVINLDGSPLKDSTDLSRRVADLPANSTHEFDILRQGKRQKIKVTIGERPSEDVVAGNDNGNGDNPGGPGEGQTGRVSETLWGLKVAPLSVADRRRLRLDPNEKGLVVTGVRNDSPLAEEGLVAGLAILEANYRPIASVEDLEKAAKDARAEGLKAVLLRIQTPQNSVFIGAPLDAE
jgi:serine protease Do